MNGWVNEIVIRRAWMEWRKLAEYYHWRDDKKRLERERQNMMKEGRDVLSRRSSNSSLDNSK
jgi:hypothetical protein